MELKNMVKLKPKKTRYKNKKSLSYASNIRKSIFLITLSLLSIIILSNEVNGAKQFTTSQGTFTIDNNTGNLISINNTRGMQYLKDTSGVAFASNGSFTTDGGNSNVVVNRSGTILVNTATQFKVIQNLTHFNLTFDYNLQGDSLDLYIILNFTRGAHPRSAFNRTILRYELFLDNTSLWNNNYYITPSAGSSTGAFGTSLYRNSINIQRKSTLPSPDYIYLFNKTDSFLFNIKDDTIEHNTGNGGQVSNADNIITDFASNLPLYRDTERLNFYAVGDSYIYHMSFVIGNSSWQYEITQANNASKAINKSLVGLWNQVSFPNLGDTYNSSAFTAQQAQSVKYINVHQWFPYYGDFPSNTSNWNSTYGPITNVSALNALAGRINNAGIKPFLYFNPTNILLNSTLGDKYLQSVCINATGNYCDGSLITEVGRVAGTRGLLDLTNQSIFDDKYIQLENILRNYTNFSGLYLDNNFYDDANYNAINEIYTGNGGIDNYSSLYIGVNRFLQNISTSLLPRYNWSLMCNSIGTQMQTQYCDIVGKDSATLENIAHLKLTSNNKISAFLFVTTATKNVVKELEYLWGIFPNTIDGSNIQRFYTIQERYLFNRTFNDDILYYINQSEIRGNDIFRLYNATNFQYNHSSNSDWYNLKNHTLLKQNSNNFSFIKVNDGYTELIVYGHTLQPQLFSYSNNDSIVKTRDINNITIDELWDLFDVNITSGHNYVRNINNSMNITVNFYNLPIGRSIYDSSYNLTLMTATSTNTTYNFTLQPNQQFLLNSIPSTPILNSPVNSSGSLTSPVSFNIGGSDDADSDPIYYGIQVSTDQTFTNVIYHNGTMLKVSNISNTYPTTLSTGNYFWRAFATDLASNSSFTEYASFSIITSTQAAQESACQNSFSPLMILASLLGLVVLGVGAFLIFQLLAGGDSSIDPMMDVVKILTVVGFLIGLGVYIISNIC